MWKDTSKKKKNKNKKKEEKFTIRKMIIQNYRKI